MRSCVMVWRGVWSGGLSLLEGVACLGGCGDQGACEGSYMYKVGEIIQLHLELVVHRQYCNTRQCN